MRYLIKFSYDGSKYSGYQKQLNKNTVQRELELALTKLNSNLKVTVVASGRTDAGVHALNQMAHFDFKNEIEPQKLLNSLNKLLSQYIHIKELQEVSSEFHARFNVKKKKYIYIINIGEFDPIKSDYEYQYNKKIDVDAMKNALKFFEGTHDFKSFSKASDIRNSYIRTIYEAKIDVKKEKVIISFTGNGFLRYMVRNIVGTLIDVGAAKINVKDIESILLKQDRKLAGTTAPACGLYLKNIWYEG